MLWFVLGAFCGGLVVFVIMALLTAVRSDKEEHRDG